MSLLHAAAILSAAGAALATENAGTSVATSLRQCYNTSELHDHDRRLPATMNMFIELVRLVEDGAPGMDARTLSIQLAHRFRQDGIQKTAAAAAAAPGVHTLPYSPTGEEYFKNRIMLKRLLPGDAARFPNGSLSVVEQCNLHFMMSNSVELQKRSEEATECRLTANYVRRPRRVEGGAEEEAAADRLETSDLQAAVERTGAAAAELSDCPVENGVVYTRWGDVHAGTVVAAVAAGLEPQLFEEDGLRVDSTFAVTLAGDLVEVAFFEGAVGGSFSIGARGGWKSTLAPHWYFSEGSRRRYCTNAELRADLDGLIVAHNVRAWGDRHRGARVSQWLDAYYSERGVLSTEVRACRRSLLAAQYAPEERLAEETRAFAELYNRHTILPVSPDAGDVERLARAAVEAYTRAITSIADVRCDAQDLDRTATDLILVADASWSFDYLHRTISYLLDNLDVNRYESSYAIVNAKDGSVLVNATSSIVRFAQDFNRAAYERSAKGFDGARLMTAVERLQEVRYERASLGGRSATVVLMPRSTTSDQGGYIAARFATVIEEYYPGTQHVVLGPGSRDIYASFVRNPATDVFTLPEYIPPQEDQIKVTLNQLVVRLRAAPRLIVNPRCGATTAGETGGGSDSMQLYVEPGTANYYRVCGRYLRAGEPGTTLTVRSLTNGNLTVCVGDACEPLVGGERRFDLAGGGDGDGFDFTLRAGHTTEGSNARCTDGGCRFPDNLKVTVQVDGFGCRDANAAMRHASSLAAWLVGIALHLLTKASINFRHR